MTDKLDQYYKASFDLKIENDKLKKQNKELVNKAEKLMLKYFGFTEDDSIIVEEQLKIFEIVEQLKKVK